MQHQPRCGGALGTDLVDASVVEVVHQRKQGWGRIVTFIDDMCGHQKQARTNPVLHHLSFPRVTSTTHYQQFL
jgi:hypothetical protein